MRYIKSFEKFNAIVGTGNRPELPGQVVTDDENVICPTGMEITGHIGMPIKNVRVQKLGKSPKKLKKSSPTYPEIQKRTNQNRESTQLNSLPSQS